MTTIAYKDGVIAYDSRASRGDTIQSDTREKSVVKDGVTFICCGNFHEVEEFIDIWFGGDKKKNELNVAALVIDKESVIWYVTCDDEFTRCRILTAEPQALGSGTFHALTAMDMGATAKEAVKMAMKRDPYTGGEIRTIKVKI